MLLDFEVKVKVLCCQVFSRVGRISTWNWCDVWAWNYGHYFLVWIPLFLCFQSQLIERYVPENSLFKVLCCLKDTENSWPESVAVRSVAIQPTCSTLWPHQSQHCGPKKCIFIMMLTEHHGQVIGTHDSYFGSPGFKSWPRYGYPDWYFCIFFPPNFLHILNAGMIPSCSCQWGGMMSLNCCHEWAYSSLEVCNWVELNVI